MIDKKSKLSVRRQTALLHISRSGLYSKPSQTSQRIVRRNEKLMKEIDILHMKQPWLGSRKIVTILKKKGLAVGRKLVRKLMREMSLCAIYPKENLSKRNFRHQILPYLLRNYKVICPNQVWSIDITYIPLKHGHMYLTAIIDWHSRKLLEWTLSDTLETTPVLDTVRNAVKKYGCPAIINSDQGCQFTSDEYKNLLKVLNIRQSMDGKSRWADNIMIERWFRSLKTELIYTNEFPSPRILRSEIREYVRKYNTERPHESLDYKTPEEVFNASFAA